MNIDDAIRRILRQEWCGLRGTSIGYQTAACSCTVFWPSRAVSKGIEHDYLSERVQQLKYDNRLKREAPKWGRAFTTRNAGFDVHVRSDYVDYQTKHPVTALHAEASFLSMARGLRKDACASVSKYSETSHLRGGGPHRIRGRILNTKSDWQIVEATLVDGVQTEVADSQWKIEKDGVVVVTSSLARDPTMFVDGYMLEDAILQSSQEFDKPVTSLDEALASVGLHREREGKLKPGNHVETTTRGTRRTSSYFICVVAGTRSPPQRGS